MHKLILSTLFLSSIVITVCSGGGRGETILISFLKIN